ncbi:MAG: DVUA0089 family protein [Gemmatimonadales bacterium]
MRRLFSVIAGVGLLILASRPATAQTNILYSAQFGPTTTVDFLPFDVLFPGTFDMETSGLNNIDPFIRLYTGWATDGSALGTLLAFDDDGAPAQAGWNLCTGAAGTCDSYISSPLGAGVYTLALSTFDFSDTQARAGVKLPFADPNSYGLPYCNVQGDWSTCSYNVSITSLDGVAVVTPEPATITLLGLGLGGLAVTGRRRKKRSAE